jgi:hypothetical protein
LRGRREDERRNGDGDDPHDHEAEG